MMSVCLGCQETRATEREVTIGIHHLRMKVRGRPPPNPARHVEVAILGTGAAARIASCILRCHVKLVASRDSSVAKISAPF